MNVAYECLAYSMRNNWKYFIHIRHINRLWHLSYTLYHICQQLWYTGIRKKVHFTVSRVDQCVGMRITKPNMVWTFLSLHLRWVGLYCSQLKKRYAHVVNMNVINSPMPKSCFCLSYVCTTCHCKFPLYAGFFLKFNVAIFWQR